MIIMLVIATPISNFFIIDMFHIKSFLICIIVNEPLIIFTAVDMILFYSRKPSYFLPYTNKYLPVYNFTSILIEIYFFPYIFFI